MKTLGLVSSLFIMLITTACDGNIIRPKGSDREWQQKQEQIERQEMEQEELREKDQKNREVNFTPANT